MKKLVLCCFLLVVLSGLPLFSLPVVYVSILPQLESVRAIGGGVCRAEALLGYGQNPETFQLNARAMESLRKSEVFIGIGLPFERIVLPKIRSVYPKMSFVDASAGMEFSEIGGGKALSSGCHEGSDPHVWLSIRNMQAHGRAVEKALALRFPGSSERIHANAAEYAAGLRKLQSRLEKRLAFCRGRDILVYHPAFGYFLREYGMVQRAVEKDGKAPGGRYLDQLIRDVRSRKISTLFYQPQFSDRMPRNLSRRLGLKLVTLDPLPEKYSEGMLLMADKVAAACSGEP